MNREERNKKYNEYVKVKIPKTNNWPSLFNAFWVGGVICMIGQGIGDGLIAIFPSITQINVSGYISVILVFLASLLTGLGIYDRIGAYAGGGSIVPITGFSNSITSPAMEFKHEGIIYGICVKMFTIAGPVIVVGVVASAIVGLIYLFI
ncbi:MAG: SpoVA/SpoVAEb family sporulation membrane protein [Clostridia bacterium]|nr:SpoVA/SpoVAEb family sporulation membrane protein [Clostridia bacterium]